MATEACPLSSIEKELNMAKSLIPIGEKIQKIQRLKRSLDEYHQTQEALNVVARANYLRRTKNHWQQREELYRNWRSSILEHWLKTDVHRFAIRRFAVSSSSNSNLDQTAATIFNSAASKGLREGQMILLGPVDWSSCYRKYYYIPNEQGVLSLIEWHLNDPNTLICNYYLKLGLTMGDLEVLQTHKVK